MGGVRVGGVGCVRDQCGVVGEASGEEDRRPPRVTDLKIVEDAGCAEGQAHRAEVVGCGLGWGQVERVSCVAVLQRKEECEENVLDERCAERSMCVLCVFAVCLLCVCVQRSGAETG